MRAHILLLLFVTTGAPAGAARQVPARPRLDARADTNDWEAYYNFGLEALRLTRSESAAAFYWSARLNPSRAEPLFGQFVAFHMRNPQRFQRLLAGDSAVLALPEVRRADSLRLASLRKNPFVFQGLIAYDYQMLPGDWRENGTTAAWLAYANHRFAQAASAWAVILRHQPREAAALHFDRALCFIELDQDDSAVAELQALLAVRPREGESASLPTWERRAFLKYALGRLEAARGDLPAAADALKDAIVLDMSVAAAHGTLAEVALRTHDSTSGLSEYAQAVELDPSDGALHYDYGRVLYAVHRQADAEAQFRAAIALEPYFADSYFGLGAVLLQRNARPEALAAFRAYVARAFSGAGPLPMARQQIELLAADSAAGHGP